MASETEPSPPPEIGEVRAVLPWNGERVGALLGIIDEWLPGAWKSAPVYAGILIGGTTVIVWKQLGGGLFDLYELLPGVLLSTAGIVLISLLSPMPSVHVRSQFDKAIRDIGDSSPS